MKKLLLIVMIVVLVMSLSACGKNDENSRIKQITYSQFKKKLENKETFMLEVVQTGCGACKAFKPKFQDVLEEYDLMSFQINWTNMNKSDYDKFYEEYNVSKTPNVLFFVDGEEYSVMQRIVENISKTEIKAKLKFAGYIE